jgi:hypothetical protein
MLYPPKHSVFVCPCRRVPKHIYTVGILPFFVFPAYIPLYSTMKNKKGLAAGYTIYGDVDLECSLAFIPATPSFLKPYGFLPLLFISL